MNSVAHANISPGSPLDDDGLADIRQRLERSFNVETITSGLDGISVTVRDDIPDAELKQALGDILRVRRYASGDCVFTYQPADWRGHDPQPALEAKGEVHRLGPGLFAFRGDFLRVRTALDRKVQQIAARRDAEELAYPPVWPTAVLQDINYFHDFPQLALLATGVVPDYAARSAFAQRFRKDSSETVMVCSGESGLAAAQNALAPTVCDCCYWLLRERQDVTDQIFTIHGDVFRNESSTEGRLDRLTAYTMREIVMIGDEAFVMAHREALLCEIQDLVQGLDLHCRIEAADDPFFSNDALQKNSYQNISRLKYEVLVKLFNEQHIAVASINLHQDYFSRSYDYVSADGNRPISACVGFGYERLTYALFCRHGAELATWPEAVRRFLLLK